MRFIFQEFIVDSELFLLTKSGLKLEVEPRVFELLIYLCLHPNVPISRDELIEHVWQQRIVGYAAINRAISELRKVLEKEPSKPEIIITVSKVGYQFTILPKIEHPLTDNKVVNSEKKSTFQEQTLPDNIFNEQALIKDKNTKRLNKFIYLTVFLLISLVSFYYISPNQTTIVRYQLVEKPLTSLKGTAFKAVLSENAEDLLFIHKDKANSSAEVWLQKNNAPPLQLTNDSYYYTFAVFGSENHIIASRFNNLHQRKCDIVKINIHTLSINPIFECSERALTVLSYDNSRNTLYLNYRAGVNSPFSIYAYQLATSRLQQITFPYRNGNIRGDYMLALSPAKDKLAVFEYQNNTTSLLKIIDINDNGTEYHEQEFSVGSNLSWLDEDKIVVSNGQGVLTYHLTKKSLNTLVSNSNIGFTSANSLTGEIVFDKGNMIANLYQYKIKNETKTQIEQPVTYSSFLNYQPQFANLTNKSAYISTNDGYTSIMIQPEQGLPYKADFSGDIKRVANFHWSPDDNYLIATINSQLQLFNEKNKHWQSLLPSQKKTHFAHFSNEENIIFSSDISGDWQIWCFNTNSKKLTQITEKGGYSAQGNIDSGYLYLTKFNHPGLYRLNLVTSEEEKLISDFKITSWKKWQLRANTIYYETEKSIKALNVKNGSNKEVLLHNGRAPTSFSVSFDEQLIQREIIEESNSNIWLISTK